jgi:hypothetical protein
VDFLYPRLQAVKDNIAILARIMRALKFIEQFLRTCCGSQEAAFSEVICNQQKGIPHLLIFVSALANIKAARILMGLIVQRFDAEDGIQGFHCPLEKVGGKFFHIPKVYQDATVLQPRGATITPLPPETA